MDCERICVSELSNFGLWCLYIYTYFKATVGLTLNRMEGDTVSEICREKWNFIELCMIDRKMN